MRNPQATELSEALQVYALRRRRDEAWARRVIKRTQQRAWSCRVCVAVVRTFRQLMSR